MIISDGHARALLRTLVREHSARARGTVRSLGASLAALPEKRTRLAAFVEQLRGRLATDALLVIARHDKRRAVLHAVTTEVAESGSGWVLELRLIDIALRPGRIPEARIAHIPVRITGHALERIFQRTRSNDWRAVIAELEPVAVMTGWLYPPLIELGCAQAAVQTRSGLLLGSIGGDGRIVFKTFLRADEDDQPRYAELRRALWGFWIRNGGGRVLGEALFGPPETQARLIEEAAQLLAAHPWLACRHAAGADHDRECWKRPREASLAAG